MIVLDCLINLFFWIMFHLMVNSTDMTAFGLAAFLFIAPYSYDLFKLGLIKKCITYEEGIAKKNLWFWVIFGSMFLYGITAFIMTTMKRGLPVEIMRYILLPLLGGYCFIGTYYNKKGGAT